MDIKKIPGTYVFDKEHSRKGYRLNMFCMSLNTEANREAFRSSEEDYLDQFPMTVEQRQAVLDRDWLGMLQLGGNIYYTFKIAIFDRITMQAVSGAMSDMTEDEFKQVMLTGGKDMQGLPRRETDTVTNNNG
jgi:protocatechuate 4,5-dioxygenase alpha chain